VSAYLGKPATDVIPSYAHYVAPLERPPTRVISGPITQERAVTKAEVLYERGILNLDVERRREKV
jgi:hypothetical protein